MPSNKADNENEFKGEPLDEELENGPMENRSCTDILCCLLFFAFLGGMIGIAAYGLSRGNPAILGRGLDQDKNVCGISAGYEDYPYLYFTIPQQKYLKQTLCVKMCPAGPFNSAMATVDCKFNSKYANSAACTGKADTTAIAMEAAQDTDKTGHIWVYDTTVYFDRYCLPRAAATFASDAMSKTLNSDLLEQWFSDVKTGWPVIAVSAACAFIIGLIYMVLLRCCSGILTWGAILGYIAGLAILGWRFYQNGVDQEAMASSETKASGTQSNENYQSQKIIGYVLWAICGISCVGIICMYNRIRLAIAIIKAASDYVRNTLSVFLVPPIVIVALVGWYIWWTFTSIYLVSTGQAAAMDDANVATVQIDTQLKRMMIYQLLALLWVNAFILASTQFIIASSTALWYFAQGTGQGAGPTVSKSAYRLFRYHLGSIAFGSLLVALVQLARIICAYFQQQAKKMEGKEGKIIKFALNCLQCYLACFERFIKFINKNAYIQIALTGKNFCLAAKDGFFLVLRNPLRMGALSSIGGIFIMFGKVFVAAITALGCHLVVTKSSIYQNKLYNPFIITFIVFIFSYAIAAVFMTVYGLAADTILACFIVDEELSKKKNAPPRHCPDTLKEFLDNHGKKD